jgi:hypothetical protein
MLQVEKSTDFFGIILARGMAWGYKSFYKNAAKALDLRDDGYRSLRCGNNMHYWNYFFSNLVGAHHTV